jgi:hypothetical protein
MKILVRTFAFGAIFHFISKYVIKETRDWGLFRFAVCHPGLHTCLRRMRQPTDGDGIFSNRSGAFCGI